MDLIFLIKHFFECRVLVFLPATATNDPITSVLTTPIYLDGIRSGTIIFCKVIAPPSIQPVEKRWPDVEVVINSDP